MPAWGMGTDHAIFIEKEDAGAAAQRAIPAAPILFCRQFTVLPENPKNLQQISTYRTLI